jgi:hypothetical protein
MKPLRAVPANNGCTIHDDPELIEATRIHNELGAKYRDVLAEIVQEEKLSVADVTRGLIPSNEDVIGTAMSLKVGVGEDEKRRRASRLAVLRSQRDQIHVALSAQGDKLYYVRRDAGYRAFAKDDGGYVAAAERLLTAIDQVIALNADCDRIYKELYERGIEDVQHVLFPIPHRVEEVERGRACVAEGIELLKQASKTHAPR